jgi:hypothetical protein
MLGCFRGIRRLEAARQLNVLLLQVLEPDQSRAFGGPGRKSGGPAPAVEGVRGIWRLEAARQLNVLLLHVYLNLISRVLGPFGPFRRSGAEERWSSTGF